MDLCSLSVLSARIVLFFIPIFILLRTWGGALLIDLVSDFPNSYNTFVSLREGEGRDGEFVQGDDNGEDDNDHDDHFSARIRESALPAGRYTIEASSLSVETNGAYNLSVYGNKVTAKATGKLNETGIEFAGISDELNSASSICDGEGDFAIQNCNKGRDADGNIGYPHIGNDGDGESGFSFQQVASSGAPLVPKSTDYAATPWSCVKDNITGLMWEVKTDDNGLHDKDDRHYWYNTDPNANGGATGHENNDGAICSGYIANSSDTFCNTQAYVARVNNTALCGYNDWRLPAVTELQGVISYQTIDSINPTIDESFFPNTALSFFWSASPVAFSTDEAWGVSFRLGFTAIDERNIIGQAVRLVRGGP